MVELNSIRDRLDQVDASLVEALAERQRLVREAARLKAEGGAPLRDLLREEDILTRAALHLTKEDWKAVKDAAPGGPDALLRAVPPKRFQELFALSPRS